MPLSRRDFIASAAVGSLALPALAANVETMGQACEVAKKLSVNMLCVVGGNDIEGRTQPEMHEQIVRGLKLGAPVVEKAAKRKHPGGMPEGSRG